MAENPTRSRKRKNNVSDRQKSENKRRGSDVTATSAEDYEGRFELPYTDEQMRDMLTACVMTEVAYRHQEYRASPEMDSTSKRLLNGSKMARHSDCFFAECQATARPH